jgi:hypothetical protein
VIIEDEEDVIVLEDEQEDDEMQIEAEPQEPERESGLHIGEREVEGMEQESDEEEIEETAKVDAALKPPRVWPEISTDRAMKCRREIDAIRQTFEDDVDMYDTTMVSEYSDEIFDYMYDLEVRF